MSESNDKKRKNNDNEIINQMKYIGLGLALVGIGYILYWHNNRKNIPQVLQDKISETNNDDIKEDILMNTSKNDRITPNNLDNQSNFSMVVNVDENDNYKSSANLSMELLNDTTLNDDIVVEHIEEEKAETKGNDNSEPIIVEQNVDNIETNDATNDAINDDDDDGKQSVLIKEVNNDNNDNNADSKQSELIQEIKNDESNAVPVIIEAASVVNDTSVVNETIDDKDKLNTNNNNNNNNNDNSNDTVKIDEIDTETGNDNIDKKDDNNAPTYVNEDNVTQSIIIEEANRDINENIDSNTGDKNISNENVNEIIKSVDKIEESKENTNENNNDNENTNDMDNNGQSYMDDIMDGVTKTESTNTLEESYAKINKSDIINEETIHDQASDDSFHSVPSIKDQTILNNDIAVTNENHYAIKKEDKTVSNEPEIKTENTSNNDPKPITNESNNNENTDQTLTTPNKKDNNIDNNNNKGNINDNNNNENINDNNIVINTIKLNDKKSSKPKLSRSNSSKKKRKTRKRKKRRH